MEQIKCCTVVCDTTLDKNYWDNQYQDNSIGWDLGQVSPPIKTYIDTLVDKSMRVLIPGCGNTYEAEYLLEQGFTNITVIDIAPTLVAALSLKFKDNPDISVLLGDFFEHNDHYDLILEQTFFCALPPTFRQKYVWKMHQLLAKKGKIAGVLFNRTFENSPPFGGDLEEYSSLFREAFDFLKIETCQNSVAPRAGSELFFEFQKNNEVAVTLYTFDGITCVGCKNTILEKFTAIDGVLNASISTDYKDVLLVSKTKTPLESLQKAIEYDTNYSIIEK